MTLEVLFLGMQAKGTSLAMALKQSSVDVRMQGYDRDKSASRAAQESGAIDRIVLNPFKAAEGADLIVITLPATEAFAYLKDLVPHLKEEAVILDGSMLQSSSLRWASENMAPDRSYIGFLPVVSYEVLLGLSPEAELAETGSYSGGLFGYVISPETSERAVNIAVNLADAVGASPFFIDPAEMDAVASIVDTLPAVLGLSLLLLAADSRAWNDIMRLSGRPFAGATDYTAEHDPELLRRKMLDNRESLVAHLSRLQEVLSGISQLLREQEGDDLEKLIETGLQARGRWLAAREKGDWRAFELGKQAVDTTGFLGSLFGIDLHRHRPDSST